MFNTLTELVFARANVHSKVDTPVSVHFYFNLDMQSKKSDLYHPKTIACQWRKKSIIEKSQTTLIIIT